MNFILTISADSDIVNLRGGVGDLQDYRTVKEKAAEWNLSPRHVQYLCRSGKIEGTIRLAEVWLIPANAPSPAKKTKSGDCSFSFVGTKKKVFDSAIELFVLHGFDSVSLRDIAAKVGIRQSTIYNHFKSKQEILETIYSFYCHYYFKDRPAMEEMEIKLQSASLTEIIGAIRYDFKEDYLQVMSDISKIVFQRIGVDDSAKKIAKSLMDEGIKYVETVFDMGIDIGRFKPFDTHSMAVFINSVRIFTLYNWIMDPEPQSMIKLLEDEQGLYKHATAFIKDLGPKTL